jgi:hypothetical protein
MALAIKTPDEATVNALLKLLMKERPNGYGKEKKIVYAITRDEEGHLRIPMALAKQLWQIQTPDYTQLQRYKIEDRIVLGEGGRDHQIATYTRLSDTILKDRCTYLSVYCGAGKTVMASKLICELGLITAVVTDSTLIFPQWVGMFRKNTSAVVAEITSPVEALPPANVYVMMITAAGKMNPKLLESIKLLVVDEALYFMTPKRLQALLNFTPCYTLGLCAEVKRNDGLHCFLPYFFGSNIIRKISENPFIVYRVETKFKPIVKQMRWTGRTDWNEVLRSLGDNEERNQMLVDLCIKLKEDKIILGTKRKNHAQYIHDKLKEAGESVALLMEDAKTFPPCRILIGIYAKMGKGVDVKNLCEDWEGEVFNVAILALDIVNPEQFVGRVFRHNNPIIYDFVDDFSTLKKHFDDERATWYKSRSGKIIKMIM